MISIRLTRVVSRLPGALAPVGDACAEYGEAIITEIVDGIASCISDGFGIKSAEAPLKTGAV